MCTPVGCNIQCMHEVTAPLTGTVHTFTDWLGVSSMGSSTSSSPAACNRLALDHTC